MKLFNEQYLELNYDQLITIISKWKIKINEEQYTAIEKQTREQQKSREWFHQRAGRVTASIFKSVCKTNVEKPSISLIKKIYYPQKFKFKTNETEWGISHEQNAIKSYQEQSGLPHGLQCFRTGLIIDPQSPYFAATPDAIVTCNCCGKGCLEVKCPDLLKSMSIFSFAKCSTTCLIFEDNEDIALDRQHSYFFQIQMQMAITKTQYSDFVVWSPKEFYLERIYFDHEFWMHHFQMAKDFHSKVIMPELVGRFYSKENNDRVSTPSAFVKV